MSTDARKDEEKRLRVMVVNRSRELRQEMADLVLAHSGINLDDLVVVVPESFTATVVEGARFMGCQVVRGPVDAPLVRARSSENPGGGADDRATGEAATRNAGRSR